MDTTPQHADWKELKHSTELHIRALFVQLGVAEAALKMATAKEIETRSIHETPEFPRAKTEEEIEKIKTDNKVDKAIKKEYGPAVRDHYP